MSNEETMVTLRTLEADKWTVRVVPYSFAVLQLSCGYSKVQILGAFGEILGEA